jgi:hypothetical protein
MKTAIQELIEHIQINATKFSMMNTYNMLKVIEPYLEKEKIDIKMAYNDGRKNALLKLNKNSEEYYNLTYNQKK